LKPQKQEAKSAYQEINYGTQNTKLNQFFDEMLKKKIMKFSEKLSLLDSNETKNKEDTTVQQGSKSLIYEKETFIPFSDNTIIEVEDISVSKDVTIENVSPSPFPSYKPNPKMSPKLLLAPNDSNQISTEKISMTNTTRRNPKTLNDFPSINEKFNDDQLMELFYGNDSEEINTKNGQIVNSTTSNGKYAHSLLFFSCFFYRILLKIQR
jgi:hypothetical protein